ncbi:hypothetical protein BH20ACI4_BH20ACI4_16450 [soil metagenome]
MIFAENVKSEYRDAIEESVETILDKGNKQQKNVARTAKETDLLIRFVPLAEINCSGVTGVIDNNKTNRRIDRENLEVEEAMGEVHITFSDWCWDVAGQRGCQGTLVHEGLHAFDFARMISEFSKIDKGKENIYDLTLYQLEHRAAQISADYLVRIGKPDFIDDGLKLNLVCLDDEGKPCIDRDGIELRMQNGYGLNESNQGAKISDILGIKPRNGFSIRRFLGI